MYKQKKVYNLQTLGNVSVHLTMCMENITETRKMGTRREYTICTSDTKGLNSAKTVLFSKY